MALHMNIKSIEKSGLAMAMFSIIVVSFPLFSLAIKGWVSGVLFLSCALAVYLYFQEWISGPKGYQLRQDFQSLPYVPRLFLCLLCLIFFLPFLSVLLSQALLNDWSIARYDGPSRYIFSLLIFFAIFQFKTVVSILIPYAFPIAAIATFTFLPFLPQTGWAIAIENRLTSYFIDPLIFGQLSLVFGALSFFSIDFNKKRNLFDTLFKVMGGVAGFYLSIKSGSRTGWPAIPFLLVIFILCATGRLRLRAILISVVITVALLLASYQGSSTIREKVSATAHEITTYKWDSLNEHTSVGARISFIRMGVYYFSMRPVSGWGSQSLEPHINDPKLMAFASQETRDELMRVGFHNDFINNMVHFGVLGLISTIFVFIIPFFFFIYSISKKIGVPYSILGIAYIFIQSISCLTYHILDFKFMASFYSLLIAILMGIVMREFRNKSNL